RPPRTGIPQTSLSHLEPGRPRALQPCREPEGRGRTVRVPGDLHDRAFGRGKGAASAARQGAEELCRSEKPRTSPVAADARSTRGREVRLAKCHDQCGRNLPPAALESGASAAITERRAGTGRLRRGRADAGELAHESTRPSPGEGDARRQSTIAAWDRC